MIPVHVVNVHSNSRRQDNGCLFHRCCFVSIFVCAPLLVVVIIQNLHFKQCSDHVTNGFTICEVQVSI